MADGAAEAGRGPGGEGVKAGTPRGLSCQRGHDEWKRQEDANKRGGFAWICVVCRRASYRKAYSKLTPEERDAYLRENRRRKNVKSMARDAVKGAT